MDSRTREGRMDFIVSIDILKLYTCFDKACFFLLGI